MNLRLLSLSVLCLGLVAGCAKQSPTPEGAVPDSSKPAQTDSPSGGTPATGAAGQGQPVAYVVRNSGIQCIAPPCPTHLAVPVANPGAEAIQIHEIDFGAVGLTQEKMDEAMRKADQTPDGLRVEATIDKQANAGPAGEATVLRVKKLLQ
ncbi:MAG TPA: DUF6748 domain-containing protein [Myxococcaceae bacterium]|jgi:hypothetical protein